MLPDIPYKGSRMIFCADLIPSSFHLPLPYIMAYDLWPYDTLEEKTAFLENALANDYYLAFQHDPKYACCRLGRNEKGRIIAREISESLL